MDPRLAQVCYVCGAFFSDKVKLGMHIATCYADAVRQGVTGLPSPMELMADEKRYTEYVRDARLDEKMAKAHKDKVSYVTQDDFAAIRTAMRGRGRGGRGGGTSGGGGPPGSAGALSRPGQHPTPLHDCNEESPDSPLAPRRESKVHFSEAGPQVVGSPTPDSSPLRPSSAGAGAKLPGTPSHPPCSHHNSHLGPRPTSSPQHPAVARNPMPNAPAQVLPMSKYRGGPNGPTAGKPSGANPEERHTRARPSQMDGSYAGGNIDTPTKSAGALPGQTPPPSRGQKSQASPPHPSGPGHGSLPPQGVQGQHGGPAADQPNQRVGTGVTMLRQELTEELRQVRELLAHARGQIGPGSPPPNGPSNDGSPGQGTPVRVVQQHRASVDRDGSHASHSGHGSPHLPPMMSTASSRGSGYDREIENDPEFGPQPAAPPSPSPSPSRHYARPYATDMDKDAVDADAPGSPLAQTRGGGGEPVVAIQRAIPGSLHLAEHPPEIVTVYPGQHRPRSPQSGLPTSPSASPGNGHRPPPAPLVRGQTPPTTAQDAQQQAAAVVGHDGKVGEYQCPKCNKWFGRRGFQVHTLRCGRHATQDFTYSGDARNDGPAGGGDQPKAGEPLVTASPQPVPRAQGGGDEDWTQFMMTYPRPVLDEKPKTAAERNRAMQQEAQRRAMQQEYDREMNRPPVGLKCGTFAPADPAPSSGQRSRSPRQQQPPMTPDRGAAGMPTGGNDRQACRRCGRMFLPSRVAQHEDVCLGRK